jgi:GNAT superfamily N-acetyltransferase
MILERVKKVLADGAEAVVEIIQMPDEERGRTVLRSLEHKDPLWKPHIERSVAGYFSQVARDFYFLAFSHDAPIGLGYLQVGLENTEVGSMGHIYTSPEMRGKKTFVAVIESLLALFEKQGGKALFLQGDIRLYGRFGFAPYGNVKLKVFGGYPFEEDYFRPQGAVAIRDANWGDMASTEALLSWPGGDVGRIGPLDVYRGTGFEGDFIVALSLVEYGRACFKAATDKRGHIGATAYLLKGHSPETSHLGWVDVFAHPKYEGHLEPLLLSALQWAGTKGVKLVTAQACGSEQDKLKVYKSAGFGKRAELPWRVAEGDKKHHTVLLEKKFE